MYVVVSKLHFFSRTFITRYISGVGEVISYSGGVFLNFLPRCQWDIFTGSDSSSLSNTSFGHAPVFSDVWVSYGKRIIFFSFLFEIWECVYELPLRLEKEEQFGKKEFFEFMDSGSFRGFYIHWEILCFIVAIYGEIWVMSAELSLDVCVWKLCEKP